MEPLKYLPIIFSFCTVEFIVVNHCFYSHLNIYFFTTKAYAGLTATCQSGETLCVVTNACLPAESRCNGTAECPDGTDEQMCQKLVELNGK